MNANSISIESDNNAFQTPLKPNDANNDTGINARTVSTAASSDSSPFPLSPVHFSLHNEYIDNPKLSSLGGYPSPTTMRRANLMTLVVDMAKISPAASPRIQGPEAHKSGNTNESPVRLNKSLEVMVKSTNRILSEATYDLDKELNRDYKHQTQSNDDEQEQELCHEMKTLKHSEETFKHEMNFAMDKIAYRHASTTEWATKRHLIAKIDGESSEDSHRSQMDQHDEEKAIMDKFLEFFCCNHGYSEGTLDDVDMN